MEDPNNMKVADLRASLERRGLDTSGLKKELQERLTVALVGAAIVAHEAGAAEAMDIEAVAGQVEEAAEAVDANVEEATTNAAEAAEEAAVEEEVPVDDTVEVITLQLSELIARLRTMINDEEPKAKLIEHVDCTAQVGY